jgi:predicted RNA binding protein YcfA (HicA-like mRNA interferase family)
VTDKRLTARQLVRVLREHGCTMVRQQGSHQRWAAHGGHCKTTVPVHPGETLGIGLVNRIERDMAHCLGEGWLS